MIFVGSPFFYFALLLGGLYFILRTKFKGIVFKVIFINILSLFLLISLFDSIAIKMFNKSDSFRISSNYYHHGLKPFVNGKALWKQDEVSSYDIKTNSLGFIDETNRIVPLKKNGKRILFMGDSFIEGVGSPWNETVAGIISEKLKKENVELLNGSVVSYSPKLYWLKVMHFIKLGLKIDELFVFIDTSDIIDEVVYDYFEPENISSFEIKMESVIEFFSKNSFLFRSYRLRYYLCQINPYNERAEFWEGVDNFYALKPKWLFDSSAMEMYGRKGIELAVAHTDNLRELCEKNGIKMHIVVWPWMDQAILKNGKPQLELWKNYSDRHNLNFIQMFDLFESLDENNLRRLFIPNDIHWSKEGNRVVADYLWEQMNKPNFQEETK